MLAPYPLSSVIVRLAPRRVESKAYNKNLWKICVKLADPCSLIWCAYPVNQCRAVTQSIPFFRPKSPSNENSV